VDVKIFLDLTTIAIRQ